MRKRAKKCARCNGPINPDYGTATCVRCGEYVCVEMCIPGGNRTPCLVCEDEEALATDSPAPPAPEGIVSRQAYPNCSMCSEDLIPDDGELCGACARAVSETAKEMIAAAEERGRRRGVEAKDAAYAERNQCVALIVRMALALGWRAGIRDHEDKPGEEWESDWRNLVCIDLPTGQVSWHFHDSEKHLLAGLPQYPAPWDGHDTAEKYRRVNAALAPRDSGTSCGADEDGLHREARKDRK